MDSTQALQLFQDIIQREKYTADYCSSELQWIESRKQDWSSDRIRVGVIGVTSSGKSTLINAILGTDILSSAIAPSSGQLVCCSYGENPEIIIHFEEGSSHKLSGKNYSREVLEQYSDERFNPKNEKKVLSIELTSPLFDFGKDVLLVDSPGLDAFGLESHERLTLESLVPTIDACIYVTTMKTNSDQKTQEILNTVAKYNCPIIIVQNMLDAVRPSPSGDKTSEQVAHDHWSRVKRIVDGSDISDKGSVRIIQISAEHAKQWRSAQSTGAVLKISEAEYQKSNYTDFVQSVSSILEVQRPRIERQRLMSIRSCAQDALISAQEKVNKPATKVEDQFPLQGLKEQTQRRKEETEERYQRIMEDYVVAAHKIRVAIGVETKDTIKNDVSGSSFLAWIISKISSLTNLEESLKATNDTVKAFEEALAKLISDHNEFVIATAQKINIPSRDLLCSSSLHSFSAVSLEKKIVGTSRRVEKAGPVNWLKRKIGSLFDKDWGYKYEPATDAVIDAEATKKKICDRLSDAYSRYSKSMEDWAEKNFNRSMQLINERIESAEESYQRRKNIAVEVESLSRLCTSLKLFVEKIDNEAPTPQYNHDAVDQSPAFTTKEIEVLPYIGSILEMSRSALQCQHRAITKSFIGRIGCSKYTPIIIGWDESSKNEFLWQTGIKDATVIQSPTGNSTIPSQRNRCLFILANTIQYGAALKQIAALKLDKQLTKNDYVVWVVQDFQELLTGDRAAEGLTQMGELSGLTRIPCKSMIYIIHENPVYNIAFLEYQFNPAVREAPHKLIHEIQTKYGMYSSEKVEAILGEIIRSVHLK